MGEYRYGFNGQEKEIEISLIASHTSSEYWMVDLRLGRRWQLDPVSNHASSLYSILSNGPIYFVDPLGDEPTPSSVERKANRMERRAERIQEREGGTFENALRIVSSNSSLRAGYAIRREDSNAQGKGGYRHYDIAAYVRSRRLNNSNPNSVQQSMQLVGQPSELVSPTFEDSYFNFNQLPSNSTPISITLTNQRSPGSQTDPTDLNMTANISSSSREIVSGLDLRPGQVRTFGIPSGTVGLRISYDKRSSTSSNSPTLNYVTATVIFTLSNRSRQSADHAESYWSKEKSIEKRFAWNI